MSQLELFDVVDWDFLLVLDACRYDYFRDVYGDYLSGELKEVWSGGSRTTEWLRNTFGDGDYGDTVYVSGNPYVNSREAGFVEGFSPEVFAYVVNTWDSGWDRRLKTVPPRNIVKDTKKANNKYPDKRIISHFVQPHTPFLSLKLREGFPEADVLYGDGHGGEFMDRVRDSVNRFLEGVLGRRKAKRIGYMIGTEVPAVEKIANRYGLSTLREAYTKNLAAALEEIERLVEDLSGKIVVTSDHGELLGEDGEFGHPPRCCDEIVRTVPWLEIEK